MRLLGITRLAHLATNLSPEFKKDPVLKKEMQKMFADFDPKAAAAVLKDAFTFDSRSWMHNISCPTLIIGGLADTATPIHHTHFLHDNIKSSQLEIFEDAGHFLLWTHSKRLISVVKNFLR